MTQRGLRTLVLAGGLGALMAGCASPPPPTFDLSAPRDFGRIGAGRGQLAVGEPVTVQAFDSERLIVKDGGTITYLGGAQWSDRLPRLIQTRLIETFENGSRLASVNRPGGGFNADYFLATELRAFQIDAASGQAVVEITAKLVTAAGNVLGAKLFTARVPVGKVDGPEAARALDQALGEVLIQIARWASGSRA